MPSSTRKWRKRQKEYERRRRQATRRHEARVEEQERKRQENLLSFAMGMTAKAGFNKNVLSQALATSKATQTNYLITLARKKRLENAKKRFFQNYNERTDGSQLHYAIQKEDPFAVKLVLGEPGILQTRGPGARTPLQTLLNRLLNVIDEPIEENIWYHSRFQKRVKEKEARIEVLMKIYDLLVKAGARVGVEELNLLWSSYAIESFLDLYPELVQPSFFHRREIMTYLRNELNDIRRDIREEQGEFHRGEFGGYGFVPEYLIREEERIQGLIDRFKTFVTSFDSNTGWYRLSNEYNSEDGTNNETNEDNE